MMVDALVLTCEHAGNRVPPRYQHLFATATARAALNSHEGYDIGALALARNVAGAFDTPLIYTNVTRLLIEPNRSRRHPDLFSAFSRSLGHIERQKVLDEFYRAHRDKVRSAIAGHISNGATTLHLGIHTFTRRLKGKVRKADVGLLYDPKRVRERRFAGAWLTVLRRLTPTLRLRRNYPYLGAADGLTTYLRKQFPSRYYLGIELEVCQDLVTGPNAARREVAGVICQSLRIAYDSTS